MEFVKDHKEMYDKTKDKARKQCLCEQFTKSCKLSIKVCKTCFESQRTRYGEADAIEVERP